MITIQKAQGCLLTCPLTDSHREILSPDALEFFAELQRTFNPRRLQLLQERKARRAAIDRGVMPDFAPETHFVRASDWRVDPVPADLLDRRAEITGPADRNMMINGLNSGAQCYMADFEDSPSPSWSGTLEGQTNLRAAVRGNLEYVSAQGRAYRLHSHIATLLVRPRGWHRTEKHVWVDGEMASASLFDFALYFFHNARYRVQQGSGVYLYLPKLEHYLEARLWNDVFVQAQGLLGLPRGTVKATVRIEHILAAFQMDEMLYEMRHHSAGLSCGHWDYIFSCIKTFANRPEFLFPDRNQLTMTVPFLRANALGCIQTAHKRCTFAIGGVAAYMPVKTNAAANQRALEKVRADKRREATDGHDGTWVAHPGLVELARAEFDRVLGQKANQIDRQREDVFLSAEALLEVPLGTITEEGLRQNIRVAIQFLAAWLGGMDCVPLNQLMEDTAMAEISRAQLWQWVHHPYALLEDGRQVTLCLTEQWLREELEQIQAENKHQGASCRHLQHATELFERLLTSETLEEFLTLQAYALLD